MAKLIPIKDRVAVVRVKSELQTESGIVLDGVKSGQADKAKVIAIGPLVDMVGVGDTILLDWSRVVVTTIENNPVYLLSQDDINAVLES